MLTRRLMNAVRCGLAALVVLLSGAGNAAAHCDTLDGPVVAAAREALVRNDLDPVLIWVQAAEEAEIREAFERTVAVRKLNAAARDLADRYFFETVVRVHRAGEGAPYTGLKPAGTGVGAAVLAADTAIEEGQLDPVAGLLAGALEEGLHERFDTVRTRKQYAKDDVAAGRAYVAAYVTFVHYVEGVHEAAGGGAPDALHDGHPPTAHEPH